MAQIELCKHGFVKGSACPACLNQGSITPANATQVGGTHYKAMKIETWDFINANDIPYMEGNIIKYVARWKSKGGVEDLRKARHYIEKLIEDNLKEPGK